MIDQLLSNMTLQAAVDRIGDHDHCQAGGTILAQNEASSAVWGMPGSVARAGLASAVLHPFDLATKVARLVAHGGG